MIFIQYHTWGVWPTVVVRGVGWSWVSLWCVYEGWFAKLGVDTLAVMQGAVFFSVMCWLLAVGGVEVALDMWSSWTWRGARVG